ncbi:hypothetical protein DFH29DRAFT_891579 [Suillus ampliporus]|nr:hypothetical protein DFH29DRAFT_891579 [Suillus ampliporus]
MRRFAAPIILGIRGSLRRVAFTPTAVGFVARTCGHPCPIKLPTSRNSRNPHLKTPARSPPPHRRGPFSAHSYTSRTNQHVNELHCKTELNRLPFDEHGPGNP